MKTKVKNDKKGEKIGGPFCFDFEETKFHSRKQELTAAEVKEIVGLEQDIPLVQILPDGTQKTLRDSDLVDLSLGCSIKRLPRFIRG